METCVMQVAARLIDDRAKSEMLRKFFTRPWMNGDWLWACVTPFCACQCSLEILPMLQRLSISDRGQQEVNVEPIDPFEGDATPLNVFSVG